MGGLPGGRKRFEAILAKSRSLPNSAAIRSISKKPQAPYTTPRMTSTIMEHEPRPENEMLGQKSISDLTDARRWGKIYLLRKKLESECHENTEDTKNDGF